VPDALSECAHSVLKSVFMVFTPPVPAVVVWCADVSEPENPLLTKLSELWAAVQDSDDFSTWTSLVSTAEKLVSIGSSYGRWASRTSL
jgi:hypothetical protein